MRTQESADFLKLQYIRKALQWMHNLMPFLALVVNQNGKGDPEANTFNTTDVHGRFLSRLGRIS